jgi:hypothetical protein
MQKWKRQRKRIFPGFGDADDDEHLLRFPVEWDGPDFRETELEGGEGG